MFAATLFFGCGGGNPELANLTEQEYKIVTERLDFEKNFDADMNFVVTSEAKSTKTMLMDAHVKIMYRIEMPKDIREVLAVRFEEKERVRLDKLMIPKKDYFYDSVNKAVFVGMKIPYIYMLDGILRTTLLVGYTDKARRFHTRALPIVFETRPMEENGQKYPSFRYLESFDSEKVDSFIVEAIRQEVRHANISRFDKEYIARHKALFTVGE